MATTPARSEPLLQITLLGEAIEHAPVGVFVFDEQGRYVAANRQACDLVGYDRGELLERRIGELSTDPDQALRAYRSVVDGESAEGLTLVRRKDGEEVALRFKAGRTTIGGLTFYLGIAWQEFAAVAPW